MRGAQRKKVDDIDIADSTLLESRGCVEARKFVAREHSDVRKYELICDNNTAVEILKKGSADRDDLQEEATEFGVFKKDSIFLGIRFMSRENTYDADDIARYGEKAHVESLHMKAFLSDLLGFRNDVLSVAAGIFLVLIYNCLVLCIFLRTLF